MCQLLVSLAFCHSHNVGHLRPPSHTCMAIVPLPWRDMYPRISTLSSTKVDVGCSFCSLTRGEQHNLDQVDRSWADVLRSSHAGHSAPVARSPPGPPRLPTTYYIHNISLQPNPVAHLSVQFPRPHVLDRPQPHPQLTARASVSGDSGCKPTYHRRFHPLPAHCRAMNLNQVRGGARIIVGLAAHSPRATRISAASRLLRKLTAAGLPPANRRSTVDWTPLTLANTTCHCSRRPD